MSFRRTGVPKSSTTNLRAPGCIRSIKIACCGGTYIICCQGERRRRRPSLSAQTRASYWNTMRTTVAPANHGGKNIHRWAASERPSAFMPSQKSKCPLPSPFVLNNLKVPSVLPLNKNLQNKLFSVQKLKL
jgi:hypothetical protein